MKTSKTHKKSRSGRNIEIIAAILLKNVVINIMIDSNVTKIDRNRVIVAIFNENGGKTTRNGCIFSGNVFNFNENQVIIVNLWPNHVFMIP